MREAIDRGKKSLETVSTWPENLRAAVGLVVRSPAPMLIGWGPDGHTLCNDAFSTLVGDGPAAPFGTPVREAIPDLLTRAPQFLDDVLSGKPVLVRNVQAGRASALTFASSPISGDKGTIDGWLSVITDESALRRTEVDLKQSRMALQEAVERHRMIFDSLDVGFCTIEVRCDAHSQGVDYCFVEVNKAFERQTGLARVEGQWMRTLAPDHEDYWFEIYGKVATTGEPVRFEMQAAALGRWYDVYAFRVGHPADRLVAVFFNDIKERKQSEAALQSALEELRQTSELLRRSNEDLEQFARVAGHDLKSPLRTIIASSQLVAKRQDERADTQTKRLLTHIIESSQRCFQLVEDLLQYATVSGQCSAPEESAQVSTACSQAQDQLRLLIQESNATIENRVPDNVLVYISSTFLTQVFQNLIGNAIHYRREHATPDIDITATREQQHWRIAVQDNGLGIEPQYTTLIFEPFRRLHGSETPGSGIGLATCKRIVERAGGKIWVDSEPGKGSTFQFILPAA